MTQRIIGKCSLCGGRVILETVQWIVGPPMPARCEACGASEDQTANMPTVPMRPSDHRSIMWPSGIEASSQDGVGRP